MTGEQLQSKRRTIISFSIKITIILIAIFIIAILLFKHYIQNDTQIPLKINKILTVSTASGVQDEEGDTIWDLNLNQDNDIYIYLEPNKNYANKEKVKKITIEKFSVIKQSKIGTIEIHKDLDETNTPIKKIEYNIVDIKPDLGINNICEKGGVIKFKISNTNVGEYISNEEVAINHDGTILEKVNINLEDIKFDISFNLVIENTDGKKYSKKITLNLPVDNILEAGVETKEITDSSGTKFERLY